MSFILLTENHGDRAFVCAFSAAHVIAYEKNHGTGGCTVVVDDCSQTKKVKATETVEQVAEMLERAGRPTIKPGAP